MFQIRPKPQSSQSEIDTANWTQEVHDTAYVHDVNATKTPTNKISFRFCERVHEKCSNTIFQISSTIVLNAFREMVKVGPFGIAPGTRGKIEASTTRRLSTPFTLNFESTQ
jgi:hypothetical protein